MIDLPSYSGGINPIENVWAIMKHKLGGRKFSTMTSLKNEQYSICKNLEGDLIKKIGLSIYNRIDNCVTTKGELLNY